MGVRGELFSTKIILPNRTYFFNVKENRMGDLYLNIVESKNRETGGFDRQSVILFADDLQEFLKGFDESLKVMEKAVRDKRHFTPARDEKSYRREKPDRDEKEKREFPAEKKARKERQPRSGEGHFKKDRTARGHDRPEGAKRESGRYNGGRNEGARHGGRRVVVKKRDK